jgi:hypothetical protein
MREPAGAGASWASVVAAWAMSRAKPAQMRADPTPARALIARVGVTSSLRRPTALAAVRKRRARSGEGGWAGKPSPALLYRIVEDERSHARHEHPRAPPGAEPRPEAAARDLGESRGQVPQRGPGHGCAEPQQPVASSLPCSPHALVVPPAWTGGHGTEPYEQNAQQSPAWGRRRGLRSCRFLVHQVVSHSPHSADEHRGRRVDLVVTRLHDQPELPKQWLARRRRQPVGGTCAVRLERQVRPWRR